MNDLTNITPDNNEVAAPALVNFDANAYAVATFEPFKKQIAKAKREADKTTDYDITTGAGMDIVKKLRASFRDIRLSIDNTRKERKAPILDAGKLLDARAKTLTAEVEPLEEKYDAQIKAEEARKAAEKARKEAEERARVEAIEGRLANIRAVPGRMASADSTAIRKEIDQWTLLRLDPADYQEYLEDALTSVNTTVDQLGTLLAAAEAREAEARRVAEERAELARMKQEQAEREAKQAAEEAERERLAKAERDAAAAREAEREREMAALRAQLAAMQAAAAPAPAPEPAPVVVPVELDDTGITIGAAVVNTEAPAEGMHAVVEAGPEVFRAIRAAASNVEKITCRPADGEIVEVLATNYCVSTETVIGWLRSFDL